MHPDTSNEGKAPTSVECVAQDLESLIDGPSSTVPDPVNHTTPHLLNSQSQLIDCIPSRIEMASQNCNNFSFPMPRAPNVHVTPSRPPTINPYQYTGTVTTASTTIQFPSPSASRQMQNDTSSKLRLKLGAPRIATARNNASVENMLHSYSEQDRPKKTWNKSWKPEAMCTARLTKRKPEPDVEDHCPQRKIHVNEDRMAARMQELHLDNNNLEWHPNLEDEPWFARVHDPQVPSAQMVTESGTEPLEMESEDETREGVTKSQDKSNSLPTLELSNELQMDLKSKEIVPQLILDELNKPRMQVVLWKPPGNFVKEIIPTESKSDHQARSQGDKNSAEKLTTDDILNLSMNPFADSSSMEAQWDIPVLLNQQTEPLLNHMGSATFDSVDDEMEL